MTVDSAQLVRQYYDALDGHEYGRLERLLTPAFVQHRPDRTFEGRDAFVRFMREERPNPDTSHELVAIVADDDRVDDERVADDRVAVRGRVIDQGESENRLLFEFADFFAFEDGRISELETYSR